VAVVHRQHKAASEPPACLGYPPARFEPNFRLLLVSEGDSLLFKIFTERGRRRLSRLIAESIVAQADVDFAETLRELHHAVHG